MATAKKATAMPNLAKMSVSKMIDNLGDVRKQMKELKVLEGFYKEALQARVPVGDDTFHGKVFSIFVTEEERRTFDSAMVKEEMGDDWWDERCYVTSFKKVSTPLYVKEDK